CTACAMELMHVPMNVLAEKLNIPFAGGAVGYFVGTKILMTLLGEIGMTIVLAIVILISAVCLFDFLVCALFKNPRGTLGILFKKLHHWMIPPDLDEEDAGLEAEVPRRKKRKKKEKAEAELEPEEDVFKPASRIDELDLPPVEEDLPFLPEPEMDEDPETSEPEIPVPVPQPMTQTPVEPSVFKTGAPANPAAGKNQVGNDDDDLPLPGHTEGSRP